MSLTARARRRTDTYAVTVLANSSSYILFNLFVVAVSALLLLETRDSHCHVHDVMYQHVVASGIRDGMGMGMGSEGDA